MPLTQIILVLLVSIAGCWSFISILIHFLFHPAAKNQFLGINIQGLIPANQHKFARSISGRLADWLKSSNLDIRELFSDNALEGLRPDIEEQVDIFLRDKLKEAFPLMHQMMGEKTLLKFRTVFLEEVERILPALVEKHASGIISGNKIQGAIEKYLSNLPAGTIEKCLRSVWGKRIRYIKCFAALTGLLIGILQIAIIVFLNQAGS